QLVQDVAMFEESPLAASVVYAISQALRVVQQARAVLLEGHVQAPDAFEGTGVEDVVRERRLHRPGRAGDQHDVALRDPASQDFIEAVDVRWQALHRFASTISSSRCRIDSICFRIRSFSSGTSTT